MVISSIAICVFVEVREKLHSILREIKARTNKKKAQICDKIAIEYYDIQSDSILKYGKKCVYYAEKAKNDDLMADGLMRMATAFRKQGEISYATDAISVALKIRERLGLINKVALTYLELGNLFKHRSELDLAEGRDKSASDFAAKALTRYSKAHEIAILHGDSILVSKTALNVAAACFAKTEYDRALEFYDQSSRWCPVDEVSWKKAEIRMNVYTVLYERDNAIPSKTEFQELETLFITYGASYQLANWYITYSGMIWDQDPVRSIKLLIDCNQISKKINNVQLQIDANYWLFESYSELGDFENALDYFVQFKELSDNVLNDKSNAKIEEVELKYAREKLEKELVDQKLISQREKLKTSEAESYQDKLIWGFVITTLTALGIVVYTIQRIRILRYRRKTQTEAHEKEVNSLIQQQESKSFEAMLEGQDVERKRIAEDLHDRLGSTLSAARMYLEVTGTTSESDNTDRDGKAISLLDDAIDDVRNVAHDLVAGTLSKFGFFAAVEDLKSTIQGSGKVAVTISYPHLELRLPSETELQLYRIVQEVFSNSLKYAEASLLTFKCEQKDFTLNIRIADNGNGFDLSKYAPGMGIKNIHARASKINASLKLDSGDSGTTYHLQLKIKEHDESDYR